MHYNCYYKTDGYVVNTTFTVNRTGRATTSISGGRGPIWLDDVECTGTETSIANCTSKGWAEHDCSHSEDAGVLCNTRTFHVNNHPWNTRTFYVNKHSCNTRMFHVNNHPWNTRTFHVNNHPWNTRTFHVNNHPWNTHTFHVNNHPWNTRTFHVNHPWNTYISC